MGFLSAAIGLGSLAAGYLLDDSDEVEAENRRNQAEARGLYGQSRDELSRTEGFALADIDTANLLLAGLDEEMLSGLDEAQRIAISQSLMDQESDRQATEQRLASAGLDSTTAGAGLQRSQRYGQAQQLGQISASFAGQRSNALFSARNAQAGGLFNRAQTLSGFGFARANSFQDEANLVANTQVVGSGVGAAVGQIGGSISHALYNAELSKLLGGGSSGGGSGLVPGQMGPATPDGFKYPWEQ
jgi:hypothetical protein